MVSEQAVERPQQQNQVTLHACMCAYACMPGLFWQLAVHRCIVLCVSQTNNAPSLHDTLIVKLRAVTDVADAVRLWPVCVGCILTSPVEYNTPSTRLPASVARSAAEPLATPSARDSTAVTTTMATPASTWPCRKQNNHHIVSARTRDVHTAALPGLAAPGAVPTATAEGCTVHVVLRQQQYVVMQVRAAKTVRAQTASTPCCIVNSPLAKGR